MQFIKIYALLVLGTLYFLAPADLSAQELRENAEGEKIIVYPDGTWQYFTEFMGAEKPDEDGNGAEKKKYPTFTGDIAPLEGNISLTENDFRKLAAREAQMAKNAAEIANERALEAADYRKKLEDELLVAKGGDLGDEGRLKDLQLRLDAAKKSEYEASTEAAKALKEAEKATEMVKSGEYARNVKEKYRSKGTLTEINSSPSSDVSYQNLIELDKGLFAIDKSNHTSNYPPVPNCKIAFDGVDNFNGQKRKDVQKQLLFAYTDERLRPYLKGKEYLTCEGFMTALASGYRYLSLQFTFAYPNAREAYGFIEKGSVLTLLLLDGNYINLQSGKMDKGSYNTEEEVLTYRVHYPITRTQLNTLKKSELSKVRVFWSSGHEDYEVYQVDFFINQISCLEK